MNKITSILTKNMNGVHGLTHAIMMGLDITDTSDPDDFEDFMDEVSDAFSSQVMISPPDTNGMLITIIGDCTSSQFKDHWELILQRDPVLGLHMQKMLIADVIQGSATGTPLNQTSLKS